MNLDFRYEPDFSTHFPGRSVRHATTTRAYPEMAQPPPLISPPDALGVEEQHIFPFQYVDPSASSSSLPNPTSTYGTSEPIIQYNNQIHPDTPSLLQGYQPVEPVRSTDLRSPGKSRVRTSPRAIFDSRKSKLSPGEHLFSRCRATRDEANIAHNLTTEDISSPIPPIRVPGRKDDDEKKARRKEQNRLAQQDLRRRRIDHAQVVRHPFSCSLRVLLLLCLLCSLLFPARKARNRIV